MPRVSVDLGSFKVAGKRPNLSLTLSSSFSMAVPALWPAAPTAEELCHACSTGKIWISKAGSCQIDVLSLVNGQTPDIPGFDATIVTAIASFLSECPVWKHTGLELRTNHALHAQPDRNHAQASYFLHHPDLSSEMIAPPDVPLAQFEGLRCQANYIFRTPKSRTRSKPESPKQPTPRPTKSTKQTYNAGQSHTYGLGSNPKRTRKAAVAQEANDNAGHGSSSTPQTEIVFDDDGEEPKDMESLASEAIADMACLLDFAFRKLIGVKGTSPGLRTVKNTAFPSLIDIAPAVWDLQYLQMMSVHAQVIPTIASGIARLRNAKSATLRAKLNAITRQGQQSDGSPSPADAESSATDEVKKRLWLLCQTRIRPEPIKGSYVTGMTDRNNTQQLSSRLVLTGQELGPHYMDDFSALLMPSGYHDLEEDDSDYADLPEDPLEPYPDTGCLPQPAEPWTRDVEPSSDGWAPSSEGEYFYTDGHGNVYAVEKHAAPKNDQIECPSTPQLVSSEVLLHEDEDVEGDWDEGEDQTYIMYHEAQHWSPTPGVHIHAEDVPDQPFPLPHPDDGPFGDWPGG